jgi:YD repeat-containing protein
MIKFSICNKCNLVILLTMLGLVNANAEDFKRPEYNISDRNFVNMASGNVYHSISDVSIGGNRGLSHRMSNLVHDNYFGYLRPEYIPYTSNMPIEKRCILKTGGYASSGIKVNAGQYSVRSDLAMQFDYIQGVGYVQTLRDGTEITYASSSHFSSCSSSNFVAWMTKVVKPNGFTIYVYDNNRPGYMGFGYMQSVNTNTGYQLKYEFDVHNRPVSQEKLNQTTLPFYNDKGSLAWSSANPKYIHAINNTIDYCSKTAATCSFTKTWPKSTYHWEDAMPFSLDIGQTIITIENAERQTTEYHYAPYDVAYIKPDSGEYSEPPNTNFWGMLVGIKPFNSEEIVVNYDYANDFNNLTQIQMSQYKFWKQLISATGINPNDVQTYDVKEDNSQYRTTMHFSGGYSGTYSDGYKVVSEVSLASDIGVPLAIDTWSQSILLDRTYDNNVIHIVNKLGTTRDSYDYDSRGNVTSITSHYSNDSTIVAVQAGYSPMCSNTKTCNQPIWTRDANGNQTDYTYDGVSGQVATITQPANEDGLRPQTRNIYNEEFATYKTNSTSSSQSNDGIWLLHTQSSCINSNYSGSACIGNDEAVTTYEYESGNLHLIGVTVTAANKTLRTCYRYDIYGNQIGETKPKANVATCSY